MFTARRILILLVVMGLCPLTAWAAPWDKSPPRSSSYPLPQSSAPFEFIRVRLKGDVSQAKVFCKYPFVILDKLNRPMARGQSMNTVLKPMSGGVLWGKEFFRSNPIIIESSGHEFMLDGQTFRYRLRIWSEPNGTLNLINDIPLEDYLKGVLPSEMSAEWPLESLKSQAIASRTFAMFRMMENQKDEFDVTKDTVNQVYRGKALEHSASTRAVRETQGKILTHDGRIFPSYFHSTCGGHTADISAIWNMQKHPSLRGVVCDFCRGTRHFRWDSQISSADLASRLSKAGYSITSIQSLRLEDYDSGGRASTVVIRDIKGEKVLRAGDFRYLAGPNIIRSTLITKIEKKGGMYYFRGRGWGHGIGLCQYGARRLGELGYNHRQILSLYYPDAQITQFGPPLDPLEQVKEYLGDKAPL